MNVIGKTEREWPEARFNGVGPIVFGMNEHSARRILEFPNATLCNAVLKVGIDATVRGCLTGFARMIGEFLFNEPTVVAVVVGDGNA